MGRFETGENGNPHYHGFSVGSGAPQLGRVRGDVAADAQSDQGKDSDDDGLEPDEVKLGEEESDGGGLGGGGEDASERPPVEPLRRPGAAAAELVPPPPDPSPEPRPKRRRELRQRQTAPKLPDSGQDHGVGLQNQSDMERAFARFFGDPVSEWNPCYDDGGCRRFLWDQDVGAHDVEVPGAVNPACPERSRLRPLLDAIFETPAGEPADLTPVRRLVAALVESGGRHKLHKIDKPVLGKHSCARGKPECPVCRYGFPLDPVGRGGNRPMRLDKGDKLGSWFARFPRNDRLCCNHEAHVLLDNLGNIDWRPCMNLWAVCEYVTKYATKAPKGSKRLGEVLRAAVGEICKYEPENQGLDLPRKSLQTVFAETLDDRDYGIFEAVHVGLRLPLVFSLLECVSLNTAGARVLRPMRQIQEGADDAPVTWDSKVDKFDDRWQVVEEKQSKTGKLTQADVAHTSLYEFWWKFRLVHGKLVREILPTSACSW